MIWSARTPTGSFYLATLCKGFRFRSRAYSRPPSGWLQAHLEHEGLAGNLRANTWRSPCQNAFRFAVIRMMFDEPSDNWSIARKRGVAGVPAGSNIRGFAIFGTPRSWFFRFLHHVGLAT